MYLAVYTWVSHSFILYFIFINYFWTSDNYTLFEFLKKFKCSARCQLQIFDVKFGHQEIDSEKLWEGNETIQTMPSIVYWHFVKSLSGQFSVNICEAPGVTCNIGGEAIVSSGILRVTIFNVTLLHVACTMCDCSMM